jgi:23S rRNA pseudouridine2605 synthase
MSTPENGMRLNRFLARAGLGSRRSVEEIIRNGHIKINGEKARDMGRRIDLDNDEVSHEGVILTLPDDFRVYAFNKPLDVVSTLKCQGDQPYLLPYRMQSDIPDRFNPVGRLDSETTGLLLWTDDGDLNQTLCSPASGVWKRYEVELNDHLPEKKVKLITQGGIELDGYACMPCKLELQEDKTTRHWIIHLHEGRKRQIRRMFRSVGVKVLRLHRTQVGSLELGKLRPGDFRRLNHTEVEELRQLASETVSVPKRPRRKGKKRFGKKPKVQ